MMVFKRKQIVVLSLVLMIIIAGYLQYSYKRSSSATNEKENGRLGEAVYVDNDVDSEKSADKDSKAQKDTSASKLANDFFAQAKLDREVVRSRDLDTLKGINDDTEATKEVKAQAYEQMMKIIDNSQREMRIETLIMEKGFEDAVALFADDGSVDIIVKAPTITSADTAQIADIVSRHAQVEIGKINIKNVY